jgi:hypothetical protein
MGMEGGGGSFVLVDWSAASFLDGAPLKRIYLQPSAAQLAISMEFCKSLMISEIYAGFYS